MGRQIEQRLEAAAIHAGLHIDHDAYGHLGARHACFHFQIKQRVQIDLPAVATPVADDATRRWVLTQAAADWYRSQAQLDDLVARSPMVELTFTEAG